MEITATTTTAPSVTRTKLSKHAKQRRALFICIVLTIATMVVEFIASAVTGSLMLYSDALHMLSHAASLGVSWLAVVLLMKKGNKRMPFGWIKVEMIAALINGIGLAVFSGYILYESGVRLLDPAPISSNETIVVAFIGLIVNLTTALILSRAGLEDLNSKSAFLHMLADTFSSLAILAGGIVIHYTDWFSIDAILSMVVAIVIAKWSWGLLKEAVLILLGRVPTDIDLEEMEAELKKSFPELSNVEELKVWQLSSEKNTGQFRFDVHHAFQIHHNQLQRRLEHYLVSNYQLENLNIQLQYR